MTAVQRIPDSLAFQRATPVINKKHPRLRLLAGVGIALLGVACSIAFYVDRLDRPLERSVKQTFFRFPAGLPSEQVSHTFVIENRSGETLHFQHLDVSCTCTRGDLKEIAVPPWGSTELVASMIVPNSDSTTEQWIRLRGMCGENKVELRYRLTGIAASMVTSPRGTDGIDLGEGRVDQAETLASSIILTRGSFPAKWDSITSTTDSPAFASTVSKIDNDHWQLAVRYSPSEQIGPVVAHATLHFKDGDILLPQEDVEDITAQVTGTVSAAPTAILFGAIEPGVMSTRKVLLSAESGTIKLEGIEIEPPSQRIQIDPPSAASPNLLLLHYTAGTNAAQDSGNIVLHVSNQRGHFRLNLHYLARVEADAESRKRFR